MYHKILLTGVLCFMPREWQLKAGMLLALFFMLLLLVLCPYRLASDDELHMLAQAHFT
jgi:hypothetical protein